MTIEKQVCPEGTFYSRDGKDEAAQSDDSVGVAVFLLKPCRAFVVSIDDMSAFAGIRFKRNTVWCDVKRRVEHLRLRTVTDEYGDIVCCDVFTSPIVCGDGELLSMLVCEADDPVVKKLPPH